MCSSCCALALGGEHRENQFDVATGVNNRTCGGLGGEDVIKVVRRNKFGFYSSGLR